jgi:hypothetical protein
VRQQAERHVMLFKDAVASNDFAAFLAEFTGDAVVRFENVPGVLEYRGAEEITAAYAERSPDDQIAIVGEPREEDGTIAVPFTWLSGGPPGELQLTFQGDQISRMVVVFHPSA